MSLDDPKCKAHMEKLEGFVMGCLTIGLIAFLAIFWLILQP